MPREVWFKKRTHTKGYTKPRNEQTQGRKVRRALNSGNKMPLHRGEETREAEGYIPRIALTEKLATYIAEMAGPSLL